ncbi:MAG: glycosyltransferase family 2 protein [Deltaproteobacteria bacterium]|jgi:hypothetical protein|nr:glycosyltransferase family 2 protein [Deltaproteobacteria bacterium]
MSLDVIILTKNEAVNLPACLDSLKSFAEPPGVTVIDDGSDDETVALAGAAGAAVFDRRLDSFAAQRNFALEKSQADWVFFLDADERFTPTLARSVERTIERATARAAPVCGSCLRRNFAFGRRQRFGPLAADRVVRLFPRREVRWEGLVHERPVSLCPVVRLGGALEHRTYRDWSQFLEKLVKYAKLWAVEAAQAGRRATALKAAIRAATAFGKTFVCQLGFLGGPTTWALCLYNCCYTLSKYLFLSQRAGPSGPTPSPTSNSTPSSSQGPPSGSASQSCGPSSDPPPAP